MRRRRTAADAAPEEAADESLQRRLAELFELLLCDIARMGAGEDVAMPYAQESVRRTLAEPFARLRRHGVIVETQFSEPVALGVAYFDAHEEGTVWVEVETDEWTTYEAVGGGWTRPLPCRPRRLVAEVDATCSQILQLGRGAT